MIQSDLARCAVCDGSDWDHLPNPAASTSLLSDFRQIDEPLSKLACGQCNAVTRTHSLDPTIFDTYSLYASAAGERFENERQRLYARWIASVVAAPQRMFEAGCGNGSLLLALRNFWPAATFRGREPSRSAAQQARALGFDIDVGYVDRNVDPIRSVDLALAVNVIEHVPNAATFLRSLAELSQQRVAIVCPDGDIPSVELLFADHIRTLTRTNVAALFIASGLSVEVQVHAPAELGPYILTVGTMDETAARAPYVDATLNSRRHVFLERWRDIDAALLSRIGERTVFAFGIGETAALLRTYAPQTWQRVVGCVADEPRARTFGDRPVVAYRDLAPQTILLATRASVQAQIASRLSAAGHTVIAWEI